MSWTRSRSAPRCNHLPFCHAGRCSKTLPNRYCFTPGLASWLFHLASEIVRAGISLFFLYLMFLFPFLTVKQPQVLYQEKRDSIPVQKSLVSSLAGGTIHPVAADYFFSLLAFFQVPLLLKKNFVYHEQRSLLMREISQKPHSYQRF